MKKIRRALVVLFTLLIIILDRKVQAWWMQSSSKTKIASSTYFPFAWQQRRRFRRNYRPNNSNYCQTITRSIILASNSCLYLRKDKFDDNDDDSMIDVKVEDLRNEWGGFFLDEKNNENNNTISSLFDLDKRLQQRLGEQNIILKSEEGEQTSNGNLQNDNDTLTSNDLYLATRQKARAKLQDITNTIAVPRDYVDSRLNENDSDQLMQQVETQKEMLKQQQAQQRMQSQQRDGSIRNISDSTDNDKMMYMAKTLDDDTLNEWLNLENQLGSLRTNSNGSVESTETFPEEDRGRFVQKIEESNVDESTILDGLSSVVALAQTYASPNAVTLENKKSLKESDYEINDDGVFLSSEAYQQACANVNSGGYLNFGDAKFSLDDKNDDEVGDSSSSTDTFSTSYDSENQFASPSVLKAMAATPMAPYDKKIKDVTIEDLSHEAIRSRRFVQNNPDIQEELHRRLMAEEPKNENDESDLFKEVLLDPQKANEFWNQEYFDEKNDESNALEDLLDQKLSEMKKSEMKIKKSNNRRKKVNNARLSHKITDRDLFVAQSSKEIRERKKGIERDRLQRAKKLAKFYRDNGVNSDWNEYVTKNASTKATKDDQSNISYNGYENNPGNDGDENNDDRKSETKREEKEEWILIEDPTSEEEPFYWSSLSGEMRWDPPSDE